MAGHLLCLVVHILKDMKNSLFSALCNAVSERGSPSSSATLKSSGRPGLVIGFG